jgi:DNA-binding CsgD family transcriptional regulator
VKLLEALKQKWTPRHDRDAPPIKTTDGEAPPVKEAPDPSDEEQRRRLALLTPRERELFLLLLEGYTLKESAKRLSVKYSTANTHMTGIYKKLNVNSRAELIIRYRDAGQKPD